jgi:cytosine/adenosine deaminase-related metal-dependent hydrolase
MPQTKKISADWIFPISSPPIKNGILVFDEKGEILELIDPKVATKIPADTEKLNGLLCPGFVNTHCHLELSWMKGKIPGQTGLGEFVINVQKTKQEVQKNEIVESVLLADQEMRKNGIVAVGDISNTDFSFETKAGSSIYYHSFIEIYASIPEMAEEKFSRAKSIFNLLTSKFKLSGSVTPHATYSVSEPLFGLIKQHAEEHNSILSIHHQEAFDENLFFLNKTGWIVENMKKLGIDYSWFEPDGKSPLESIGQFLPLTNPLLLVHNTFSRETDVKFARSKFKNLFWGLCPNANLYIENQLPDIPLFIREKLKLTIGTDSLASNHRLSVLEEIKTIARVFPKTSLEELLQWACINGAEFLGIDGQFGSFEKGKTPGINLITGISNAEPKLTPNSKVITIK